MLMCRITGFLMVIYSLAIVILISMNRPVALSGGRDLSPLWVVALPSLLLGIGVFVRYKPAVVLFMILSSSCALWLGIGSLFEVPFPFALINILYAAVMISPSIYFYMNWSTLFDEVEIRRKRHREPS